MCFITDSQTFAHKHYTNQFQTDTSRAWFKKSACASCWLNLGAGNIWYRSEWTLSLPAGRLLPAGCRHLGAAGPDGLQGDRGCQPPPVHWGLRHPGHGRHAVPAGLPGLLRSHQGEQMSAALCESVINDLLDLLLKHGWTMTSCVVRGDFIFFSIWAANTAAFVHCSGEKYSHTFNQILSLSTNTTNTNFLLLLHQQGNNAFYFYKSRFYKYNFLIILAL